MGRKGNVMRARFRSRKGLLSLAVVSLIVSIMPHAAWASPSDPVADEQAFVDAINKTRAEANLPLLTVHPGLVEVARGWSDSMRKVHNVTPRSDGTACTISHNPNLKLVLPKEWVGLGENVGCGNADLATIHQKFVESPHHYENMVNPKFDRIGIGIVYEGDIMFVTEQFMDSAEIKNVPDSLALTTPAKDAKVLSASVVAPKAGTRRPVPTKKPKTKKKPVTTIAARV